jgi:muconolactone delta-isomerase
MNGEEMEEWRNYGCILEVDLDNLEELHDKYNEYPLAPERMEINKVGKIRHPPQDFKTMFKFRVKVNQDTSGSKIR